jgi:hypothetical protein
MRHVVCVGEKGRLNASVQRRALFGDSDAEVAKKLRCMTTLLYCSRVYTVVVLWWQ